MSAEPTGFKGTPGHWEYRTGPALRARYHTVEVSAGLMVCECYEGTEEEQEANARLHAASKDLLAALQGYMGAVATMNAAMQDGVNVQGAVSALIAREEQARAAIARAVEVGK